MEPKNRRSHHRTERARSHRRSPSPEFYVDLTVDSPLDHRGRSLFSDQTPEAELIDCSNRVLPPKKRSRTENDVRVTTVIDLDDSSPPKEAARINDSAGGETNVLSCPICFEYLTSKRKPTSTRCGHVYCSECIEQTLAVSKKCPKCQANITQKSCIRLYF